MRSSGLDIPSELISALLQLKLLPDTVRRQIATDLVPKSDVSIPSDDDEDYEDEDENNDTRAWINALEDDFEPVIGLIEEDECNADNIKRNQYISNVPHQDMDESLEVVSRPKLEIVEIKDEPSVSIPQHLSPPDGHTSGDILTTLVINRTDCLSVFSYKYSVKENKWIHVESDAYETRKADTDRAAQKSENLTTTTKERQKMANSEQERSDDVEDNFSKVESDRVIEWIREVQEPSVSLIDDVKRIQESVTSISTPPENLLEFPDLEDGSLGRIIGTVSSTRSRSSSIVTGGTVELPRKIHKINSRILDSDDDLLHQKVSSIMILNPTTEKYETPPPRWFNKETGDYEDIKPMYFIDPQNPALGFVGSNRVVREDDGFRHFMEEKEAKRRARAERNHQEAERAKYEALNPPPPPPPPPKPSRKSPRNIVSGTDFDEELAQKKFRQTTGKMISKRGAAQYTGPSTQKDEEYKRELEEKYGALRPFAPEDGSIEGLPDQVNAEEIINAWRNSPEVIAPKKAKPKRTEGERVKALVKSRSGKVGWTYAAMRGSYRPPNTIDGGGDAHDGWLDTQTAPKLLGVEEKENQLMKKIRGWKQSGLENTAWWESQNKAVAATQWRTRSSLREEHGRLAINPVTGKLEDIAPAKTDVTALKYREDIKIVERQSETDLLMSSPPRMSASAVLAPMEKLRGEGISIQQFIEDV